MALRMGRNVLEIGGQAAKGTNTIMDEYPALCARMAELVSAGTLEADLAPMTHVADTLTFGRREITDAFHF